MILNSLKQWYLKSNLKKGMWLKRRRTEDDFHSSNSTKIKKDFIKEMRKFLCYIFGHRYIKRAEKDNGYSLYGDMLCQRCGKVHNWQYDYDTNLL